MIGGVPRVVVLDNATEAGRRWHDVVTESKLFRRFRLHYGFEARFCNPNSGNEKGNVENKVGFIRRNYMVPAPRSATSGTTTRPSTRRSRTAPAGRPIMRRG